MPANRIHWRQRLAIIVLAFAAYCPTLKLGFLWDDHVMIENNTHITQWTWANVRHDFSHDAFEGRGDRYYRPAQLLANRLDYSLWGLRPFGYHLTNWVAHAVNAVLVAELAVALGFPALMALIAGCLFAVHPIVVEQLMIIAGRAELFGLTFTLATLIFLLMDGAWPLVWAILMFICALLFKESAVIVPALAAITFYLRQKPLKKYASLLPFLILCVPYFMLRHHAVGPALPPIDPHLMDVFFLKAFPNVLFRDAGLILVPWNLHSHRMMPHLSHLWPLELLILVGAVIATARRPGSLTFFCLAWFILSFLPKTPIMMIGNFTLDHWAYPAVIAIVLPLAWIYDRCWEHHKRPAAGFAATTLFPLLIAWALLVHLNVQLRGTDEKMYRWALNFTNSHPIQHNLGVTLIQQGRGVEAIPYLENVHAAYPDDLENTYVLAMAYEQTGHRAIARKLLESLVQHQPPYEPAVHVLSSI